jgi:indolepyruvate ferredoxin oxidoreductase beta subunit
MKKIDFLLAGVGGQGVLTASDILAEVGLAIGCDAKKSEIHGFSQRGGVVESHVRWGPKVAAPMGELGRIDYLIAFELLESMRWVHFLKPGGIAIVSRQRILPMGNPNADTSYPGDKEIDDALRTVTDKILYVEGLGIARGLGNKNLANSVVLGSLASEMDMANDIWIEVLIRRVPAKHAEANKAAFLAGRAAANGSEHPSRPSI